MDIVLAIAPRIQDDFGYTPAGPALLKGHLESQGFSACVIDFNAQLEEALGDRDLVAVSNFFINHDMYHETICRMAMQQIDSWAKQGTIDTYLKHLTYHQYLPLLQLTDQVCCQVLTY